MNENINNGIGWLERTLQIVQKYKFITVLKAFALILSVALLIAFLANPTYVFEKYDEWREKQHTEQLTHRLRHNEKLHILTEKLLYQVNADRVILLELHNGLSSNSGLPFAKCSATYEALNSDVLPVADLYQDLNLSLMPFANVLLQQGYWCGNTEELRVIDKALSYKMLGNDISHFAGALIKGVEKPLAFLFVKFKNVDENHNCEEVRKIINANALQFALLLELNNEI